MVKTDVDAGAVSGEDDLGSDAGIEIAECASAEFGFTDSEIRFPTSEAGGVDGTEFMGPAFAGWGDLRRNEANEPSL